MPATCRSGAPGREQGASTEPPSALPGVITQAASDAARPCNGASGGEAGGPLSSASTDRVPARDAGRRSSGIAGGGLGGGWPGRNGLDDSAVDRAPASSGRPLDGAASASAAHPDPARSSEEGLEAFPAPSGSTQGAGEGGGAADRAAGASPALRGGPEEANEGPEAPVGAAGGAGAGAEELDLTCAHLHTLEGVALPQSLTACPAASPAPAQPSPRCQATCSSPALPFQPSHWICTLWHELWLRLWVSGTLAMACIAAADASVHLQSLDLTTNRLRQLEPRLLALTGAQQFPSYACQHPATLPVLQCPVQADRLAQTSSSLLLHDAYGQAPTLKVLHICGCLQACASCPCGKTSLRMLARSPSSPARPVRPLAVLLLHAYAHLLCLH